MTLAEIYTAHHAAWKKAGIEGIQGKLAWTIKKAETSPEHILAPG
jgi:hypothetical protein